jgi:hypothetical protein
MKRATPEIQGDLLGKLREVEDTRVWLEDRLRNAQRTRDIAIRATLKGGVKANIIGPGEIA